MTEDHVAMLRDQLKQGVYGGPEWGEQTPGNAVEEPQPGPAAPAVETDMTGDALVPIITEQMEVGTPLRYAVYNARGVMLVPVGTLVTDQLIRRLDRSGAYGRRTGESEDDQSRPEQAEVIPPRLTKRLDRLVASREYQDLRMVSRRGPRPRLDLADLQAETERAQDAYDRATGRVEEISDDLLRGRPASAHAAGEVVGEFLKTIRLDGDLLPAILRLKTSPGEYLFQHGMNVALLSMSMAAQFGLPSECLLQIGLGALLQDVGMLQVPKELRLAPRMLTPTERAEIARHPLYSLDFLSRMEGIGDNTLMVVYQSHERPNAGGYPHRRPNELIHPFARLVAAADTYAALTSNRPHRNARRPYEAMEMLLRGVRRGQFDPRAARALVDCLSLFPIGSYVRLSDGQVAKVLRAHPGAHTEPVVLPLHADGTESGQEVDLAEVDGLCVAQALGFRSDLTLEFFSTSSIVP